MSSSVSEDLPAPPFRDAEQGQLDGDGGLHNRLTAARRIGPIFDRCDDARELAPIAGPQGLRGIGFSGCQRG